MKNKSVVVTKKQEALDASRWRAFLQASSTPYEDLSEDWYLFFDAQAEISTAQAELVRLVDIAIKNDLENK